MDRNPYVPLAKVRHCEGSLSARRAWIEIVGGAIAAYPVFVALRKESVDRNWIPCGNAAIGTPVALRKESVDRNSCCGAAVIAFLRSLSARRAWIEMVSALIIQSRLRSVALRKESVDRNAGGLLGCDSLLASLSARRAWIEIRKNPLRIKLLTLSLSARRAWIEIAGAGIVGNTDVVALRKESVDRNYFPSSYLVWDAKSLSARRAWIEIMLLYANWAV